MTLKVKTGAPSTQGFHLTQTFFGFKPEDRVQLHESLFNLIWIGQGRWDWQTLYTMPVHIRRFWISKLNQMQDEKLAVAEASKANKTTKKSKVVKSPL
jgi:hypothetical protein